MPRKSNVPGKRTTRRPRTSRAAPQLVTHHSELATHRRPSAVLDTRVIYCGDCLDQLRKLPDGCVDLIYIDPPFNSNRNYEVFWGETKEKGTPEDRTPSYRCESRGDLLGDGYAGLSPQCYNVLRSSGSRA